MKLISYVENNPKEFIELMGNPQEVEHAVRLDMIHQAHIEGIIVYNQSRWFWKNGGESIIAVPKGADSHDYLTGWSFGSTEGNIWWNSVDAKLNGKKENREVENKIVLTLEEQKEVEGYDYEKWLEEGKACGAIKWVKEMRSYIHNNGKEDVALAFNKEGLEELFNSEDEDKKELVDKVNAAIMLAKR